MKNRGWALRLGFIGFGLWAIGAGAQGADRVSEAPPVYMEATFRSNVDGTYAIEFSRDLEEWEWHGQAELRGGAAVFPVELRPAGVGFYRARLLDSPLVALAVGLERWWTWNFSRYQAKVHHARGLFAQSAVFTVRDGEIVASDSDLPTAWWVELERPFPYTVEELIAHATHEVENEPFRTVITPHPQFGFPSEMVIDPEEQVADDELYIGFQLMGPTEIIPEPSASPGHDAYELLDLKVVANRLEATISYSGGCKEHFIALMDLDPGVFRETAPPEPLLKLAHNDNDDPCDGIVTVTRAFDLTPLAEAAEPVLGPGETMRISLPRSLLPDAERITVDYTPSLD